MRPISRKPLNSSNFFVSIENGPVVGKIKGSTKVLGNRYSDCHVALFSKLSFQPISVVKPDIDGNYSFRGLNTTIKTFIVAFDLKQEFNALIQDSVVPK